MGALLPVLVLSVVVLRHQLLSDQCWRASFFHDSLQAASECHRMPLLVLVMVSLAHVRVDHPVLMSGTDLESGNQCCQACYSCPGRFRLL